MEVPAVVPTALRSPRPKPTPMREVPKPKKDKQEKFFLVCESPRKHDATQAQRKEKPSAKEKGKLVDLEAKEGTEDIDIKGVDHVSQLLEYIPSCKGKVKVPKEPYAGQFLLNTLMLPENITFEDSCLVQIPHLKLEDWDLADHKHFPHLDKNTYMKRVFYKESGVIVLEPVEWISRVNKSGLLNLLWVPHYHCSNINLIVIK